MKLGLKRGEVKVQTYNDQWVGEFQKVKQEILQVTSIPESHIEHIGSTSIKDMVAKPIIDIVVGVNDITKVDQDVFHELKKAGFLRLKVKRPNEIVLAKFTDDTYEVKTHFIHMVDYNKDLWKNFIFFRDFLNTNEAVRKQYEKLKIEFLEQESGGIKEYTDYKEQFVRDIYAKRV